MLAAPRAGPMLESHRRSDRSLRAGVQPGLRDADAHRRPIAVAGHRQLAAGCEQRQVCCLPADLGASLAPRRDVDGDEPVVGVAQRAEIEIEWSAVVVQHHICPRRQRRDAGRVRGNGRSLATVVGVVRVAARPPSRGLHQHHVSAELSQQVAREPAALVSQIQHSIRTKHPAPRSVDRAAATVPPLCGSDTTFAEPVGSMSCERRPPGSAGPAATRV